ncbi:MAG TPA: phosphate ABC transporter permease subunit PstC [Acidimicrobiales bacterium]|nr:phosphate ABC transporter permease subunit PstC [Acidimicrobiales bacterium]
MPDRAFRVFLAVVALVFCALCVALVVTLVQQARPTFAHFGVWSFVTSTTWDPVHAKYGALPFIVGTLETTAIAMVLAIPIGLGTALFVVHVLPQRLRAPISTAIELLAAVPSVIYGLWALLVVAPWMRTIIEPALASITGSRGPFSGAQLGLGLLLAGLVLFVMVLPTMVAISRDVIAAVPGDQVEGAFALGATRWQVLYRVVLPSARVGLLGAVTLATGRALGETIAVTMVIGNSTAIAHSLFSPAATLASVIANQFTEATEPFHLSSLIALGVVLLVVAIIVNAGARLLVRSVGGRRGSSSVVLV